MSALEAQINEANGVVYAVYTTGGGPAGTTTAFNSISPYFDGSYFTGTSPPIMYSYWPHTLVLDMEDGTVLGKDVDTTFLTTGQIMQYVNQANSD